MEIRNIMSPLEWRKIKKLYKKAFPAYERKPLWIVWLKQRQSKTDVWIIEKDGEFLGFAITINELDLVLLDYFAIRDDKRGLGFGAEALRKLQEKYREKRFFLEIESVYVATDNLPERLRRKQFYCNNGMSEMGVMVNTFGTEFELLGYNCEVSFEDYYSLYHGSYGDWAVRNILEMEYPG